MTANTPKPPAQALSPIKQALLKIDALRRELAQAKHAVSEPIAVVGIGCRLPGGADTPQQLWDLLVAGTDTVTSVPAERWTDAIYDPRPGRPDTSYCRHGAFIDGVDRFDPAFFGISGREAHRIDPQQRLLLECTWRAIEDARFTRSSIKAHKTGVFVGTSLDDYARISENAVDAGFSHAQTSLGTARPMAAGRIAYLFDFHGPTLQLDTACSSSLATMHLACQSLREHECDVALAGGVSLMLTPEMTIGLCELQALSPDGRCKTFDAAANGYVRGEGCGMVALMRLSDARAQQRPIRAVIRGSAINHDGKSNGLTAPNGRAQREVIRSALSRAGVAPGEVDYVEAHGTGTELGDPIELRALHDVYCSNTGRTQDLVVGSLKTNMGHLEAAASVAALIKVVCALQNGELPRHLHFKVPTPHVDWSRNGIRVADRHRDWPASRPGKRVAGISAFGMSGTNVHLIVESWQDDQPPAAHSATTGPNVEAEPAMAPQIFAFSAHTQGALRRALNDVAAQLQGDDVPNLPDLAHSLRVARDTHRERVALVASSREELRAGMQRALRDISTGERADPGKLGFLFTGQGAQYGGMARQLYQAFPIFRQVVDECDRYFEALDEVALVDVLWGDQQALIHQTRYTQPALFAVESALARLWTSWGIVPDVLMGHSVGEYAAACLAGVFTLEDGLKLVAARGRLMDELTPAGKMIAVSVAASDLEAYLAPYHRRIALAGDNAPHSVTLSGEPAAIDELQHRLEADAIVTRALSVSRAFHAPLMEPMLDPFLRVVQAVQYRAPTIPLVSNVSGRFESECFCDPAYWVEHVQATVNFRKGMQSLLDDGAASFVEVGPGKVLAGLAKACASGHAPGKQACSLHSFDPQHDECAQLLAALAALYASGRTVDWAAFEASQRTQTQTPARLVQLPPYPLDPGSYWVGTRRPAEPARPARANVGQPPSMLASEKDGLLGRELRLPAQQQRHFQRRAHATELPWLEGHKLRERVVFPAAAFIVLALEAVLRNGQPDAAMQAPLLGLRELSLDQPLLLDDAQGARLCTTIGAAGGLVDIYSDAEGTPTDDGTWTHHCSAQLQSATEPLAMNAPALEDFEQHCDEALAVDAFYERLNSLGLNYGGPFRSIRRLARGPDQALARIELDAVRDRLASPVMHPALLDNCFQVVAAALGDADTVMLPVGLERVLSRRLGAETVLWCAARIRRRMPLVSTDLWLFDGDGRCVAEVSGLQLAAVDASKFTAPAPVDAHLYGLDWQSWPDAGHALQSAPAKAEILLLRGGGAIDAEIEAQLQNAGMPFVLAPDRPHGGAGRHQGLHAALAEFAHRPMSAPEQVLIYVWPAQGDQDEAAAVYAAHQRYAEFWRAVLATDWAGRKLTVCVLTRSAQQLPGQDRGIVPAQAAAWGLARSLMHESPDQRVLLIDLAGDDEARCVATAMRLIGHALDSDDAQFVVRADAVFVPRVVKRSARPTSSRLADGAYLVTGGRGAIGTRLIQWLIAKKASKVVAVSRCLPADEESERLRALARGQGTQLEFSALDITDAAQVEQLVAALEADRAHPLKGIFHAAGTLNDGLLALQPAAVAEQVLAPKVAGTLNLHRASMHLALDHFVSFSSIVSCIGSPGQCAYAAANAYVDALSLQRNAEGLPAHVINWGLWGGAGMAEQLDAQQLQRIEAHGLHALDPDSALRTLDALLAERQGQSLVWHVDVPTLLSRNTNRGLRALLAPLASGASHSGAPRVQRSAVGLGANLGTIARAASESEREAVLSRHLSAELAATLQIPADRISARAPLIELGLDSLMAAELRTAIRNELDVDIPFGRLLEGATLHDIVRTVVEKMGNDVRRAAPPSMPVKRSEAARLDAVSREATFDAELESGQV